MSSKYYVFINGLLSPSGGRVYASNVRRTSHTVWSLCLLRHDPLDLGKPLDPAAASSAILHEPRQCPSGRAIAHPLDRSAAYGYRVAFANFLYRHDCSVEVRNEFVHVEFVRTSRYDIDNVIRPMVCPSLLLVQYPKFSALTLISR
jgi:hypothetical protein